MYRRHFRCSLPVAVVMVTLVYVTSLAKYPVSVTYQSVTATDSGGGGSCEVHTRDLAAAVSIDTLAPPPDAGVLRMLAKSTGVSAGGSWAPTDCQPAQHVAIIVPYRDRPEHLARLLARLHPLLQRQKAKYTVYVIEQAYQHTFNKGLVMNIGFSEVSKLFGHDKIDCFIFHDVDMLPQTDRNLYRCSPSNPRHLSPALDEMRYVLMYPLLVGGVLAMTTQQFQAVNGFSNQYWGWGAEDDDMAHRIVAGAGFVIERPPGHIGRYKMMPHEKRQMAPNRVSLLEDWHRYPQDGVSTLLGRYNVLNVTRQLLYTNITVDVGVPPATPQHRAGEEEDGPQGPWWWMKITNAIKQGLVLWKMDI